jgi:EpsI family protein
LGLLALLPGPAGLRFLIASVAFGLLFANLAYRSAGRRIVFIGLSFVVPVIANGMRALGIVYIAYLTDNQVAVGIDRIVYGWGFFTAILLALTWIGLRFREDGHPPAQDLRMPIPERRPPARPKIGTGATALIAITILALGPAYAGDVHTQGNSEVNMTLEEPDARPPWRQVPWISSWRPVYSGATAQTSRAYSDTTATVELFAAVYADQGPSRELIGFANRLEDGEVWRRVSDRVSSLTLDGSERPALLRRLDGREGTRFVWRIYWVDGEWTASAIAARLRHVLRKLTRGQSTSAVLVLSSSTWSEAAAEAAVRRLLGSISNISAMLR